MMIGAVLVMLTSPAVVLQRGAMPAVAACGIAVVRSPSPRMADDESQKQEELAKDIPFAGYKPSKMAFKGSEYRNTPLGGEAGQRLSGPAQYFPIFATLAAIGLATAGYTESFVEELFAPVREAGGYGALLQVPDAPGMEKAKELKQIQIQKRKELLQNFQEQANPGS